jgi:hypothetical protein
LPDRSLLSTIPSTILATAAHLRVYEIGLAAGPSFVAQRREVYEPPIPLGEAMQFIERYRASMRIGRVILEDGRTWFFSPEGFRSETRPAGS